MPKMVIEVPEEFTEVGKAMAEHLAALQRTVSRLGGGKAVDYAEIEQAMAESAGHTELAGHRAILQSLDIDVAAVMIGGMRYTRVGRCEAPLGAALLDFDLWVRGASRVRKAPYDSPSLPTIFSLPRPLGRDGEAASGTVCGTR